MRVVESLSCSASVFLLVGSASLVKYKRGGKLKEKSVTNL